MRRQWAVIAAAIVILLILLLIYAWIDGGRVPVRALEVPVLPDTAR